MLLCTANWTTGAPHNEAVFDRFLAPGYEVASRQLEDATRELGREEIGSGSAGESTGPDNSLLSATGDIYESVKANADVSASLPDQRIPGLPGYPEANIQVTAVA